MNERTRRNHQINGKTLWQTTEAIQTARNEASGFWSGAGVPKPEALIEAEDLMRQAQALLIKVGQANDRKAEQDFFTDEALDFAGVEK